LDAAKLLTGIFLYYRSFLGEAKQSQTQFVAVTQMSETADQLRGAIIEQERRAQGSRQGQEKATETRKSARAVYCNRN
jgi:hypothetical protein